jgi:type IV secretory pathway VirB4 component
MMSYQSEIGPTFRDAIIRAVQQFVAGMIYHLTGGPSFSRNKRHDSVRIKQFAEALEENLRPRNWVLIMDEKRASLPDSITPHQRSGILGNFCPKRRDACHAAIV